jgi:hypothetical protein
MFTSSRESKDDLAMLADGSTDRSNVHDLTGDRSGRHHGRGHEKRST